MRHTQCTPIHQFSQQIPTMVLLLTVLEKLRGLELNSNLPIRCQEPNYIIHSSDLQGSAFTFLGFLKETHFKQVAIYTHYQQTHSRVAQEDSGLKSKFKKTQRWQVSVFFKAIQVMTEKLMKFKLSRNQHSKRLFGSEETLTPVSMGAISRCNMG